LAAGPLPALASVRADRWTRCLCCPPKHSHVAGRFRSGGQTGQPFFVGCLRPREGFSLVRGDSSTRDGFKSTFPPVLPPCPPTPSTKLDKPAMLPLRQSCDRCHEHKVRCNRDVPEKSVPCTRCTRAGATCVYSSTLHSLSLAHLFAKNPIQCSKNRAADSLAKKGPHACRHQLQGSAAESQRHISTASRSMSPISAEPMPKTVSMSHYWR